MDPNETLKRIRALIAEHSAAGEHLPERRALEIVDELVLLFDALDEWMTKGGFSPWTVDEARRIADRENDEYGRVD